MSMTENSVLTPRQVAELVNVKSLRTIRRWRKSGKLPAVEISPGVYRYRQEDVEALLGGRSVVSEQAQDVEAHIAAQRDAARFRDNLLR